jgi:hypothetical protein
MRVKDVEAGRFALSKKYSFALFYTTGRYVCSAIVQGPMGFSQGICMGSHHMIVQYAGT